MQMGVPCLGVCEWSVSGGGPLIKPLPPFWRCLWHCEWIRPFIAMGEEGSVLGCFGVSPPKFGDPGLPPHFGQHERVLRGVFWGL